MIEDDNYIEPFSPCEKVFGYLYDLQSDEIQLSEISSSVAATTKRDTLSQNSSVFDPQSLCLPVTIKWRILLRCLWGLKLSWDEKIPPDIQDESNKSFLDLSSLRHLRFPKFGLNESSPAKLIIICDASQLEFGFAAYIWQNGCAKLIFVKAKMAPLVKRTLPTLKLLPVFLSVECIPNMLRVLSDSCISDIAVAVDAQVVLSCLLTNDIKTKNVFQNKLEDIHKEIANLSK